MRTEVRLGNTSEYTADRFGTVIRSSDRGSDKELEQELEYLKHKGLIEPGIAFGIYKNLRAVQDRNHLTSTKPSPVRQELVNYLLTFDVAEPSYLELLGAEEIAKLRQENNAKFLLAGCSSTVSAEGFKKFAQKISTEPKVHVLDIDPPKGITTGVSADRGSVLSMPYENETFDIIATNNLLHELQGSEDMERDVELFIKNSASKLKRHGSLLLYETAKDGRLRTLTQEKTIEIIQVAGKKLFTVEKQTDHGLIYNFPQENGQALVGSDGQPDYRKVCLRETQAGVGCFKLKRI